MKTTIFISLSVYSTERVLHSLAIYLHILFFSFFFFLIAHTEPISNIALSSLHFQLTSRNSQQNYSSIPHRRIIRATHEKKLFNVKREANETNPYNLNYKVIQLIIVLSFYYFNKSV